MTNPRKNHAHGINLAVAQALTAARKGAGYTNESLAAKLPDLSLTSLQRYLAGRSAIDVEVLSRICLALGVNEVKVIEAAQKIQAGQLVDELTGELMEPGDAVAVHIKPLAEGGVDTPANIVFISRATHANLDTVQQRSRFFGYTSTGEDEDARHLSLVAANDTDLEQQEPGAPEE